MASAEDTLDLTSFPLLRIDQLALHDAKTLLAAEDELFALTKHSDGGGLGCYSSKLLVEIQREIASRRIKSLLHQDETAKNVDEDRPNLDPLLVEGSAKGLDTPLKRHETASAFTDSSRPPRPTHHLPLSPLAAHQQAAPFNTFVTSSSITSSSLSFKDRAKAVNRLRKARVQEQSEEHRQQLADKQREARRQQIAQRMEERRERRRRAEEAKERRRLREHQRKAEQAKKLQKEMERAAEVAREEAEFSGKAPEEAVASAAAAAALLIERDPCYLADSDSDESITIGSVCTSSSRHAVEDTIDAADEEEEEEVEKDYSSSGSSSGEEGSIGSIGRASQAVVQDASPSTSTDTVTVDDIIFQGSGEEERGSPASFDAAAVDADTQDDSSSSSSLDPGTVDSEPAMEWDPSTPTQTLAPTEALAEHKQVAVERPKKQAPPTSASRSFVSIYPQFWRLFTAFDKEAQPTSPLKGGSATVPRPTTAMEDLLKRQVSINEEFLRVMTDYSELQSSKMVPDGQSLCPSSDRCVKIGSARPDVAILISDVLTEGQDGGGWQAFPVDLGLGNCWNLLWTWSQPKLDVDTLMVCQKLNRFRGTRCLTRKDLLKDNIQRSDATRAGSRTRRGGTEDLDVRGIMPLTFVLPQEYNAFAAAFSAVQRISGNTTSNFWISKPIGLSRGRGISVINDIGDVSYSQPIVMQKYLMNPFLFRSYKFDLRLYVLVTAFSRLEAFIYSEGLARFASKPFSANPESIYDEQIHLTNSSIQKEYWGSLDSGHPVRMAGTAGGGNKVKLSWLLRRLEGQGIDTKQLWRRIKELCLKTLLVVDGSIPPQPNCFEIFGFDVILTDDDLKPLLIEVNACPALARDSDVDADVKESLIRDTIALIDPPAIDREALLRICKRRLGKTSETETSNSNQLEKDFRDIFMGRLPRQTGEMPTCMGKFERLEANVDQRDGKR